MYRSICPLVVQSYIKDDEVVNPIREHTVLNGNFAFNLSDILQ
jgi:HD superfamily phosphohydrolase YqeK